VLANKVDCTLYKWLITCLHQRCACTQVVAPILFSKNTRTTIKILEVQSETVNEKYLGLLVYISKSKETFQYIKDQMWSGIQGWKEKLLSKVGKEILIKFVTQAIPTRVMPCFDLTKT
jgi:hypothetical protein